METIYNAVEAGHDHVLAQIDLKSFNLDALSPEHDTPLAIATLSNHPACCQLLLESGANPDAPSGFLGSETPLCVAAQRGFAGLVRILLSFGAQVNRGDNEGWRPLHYAAQYGRVDILEILVVAGAELDMINHYGETPLHLAVRHGHANAAAFLLYSGCKHVPELAHCSNMMLEVLRMASLGPTLAELCARVVSADPLLKEWAQEYCPEPIWEEIACVRLPYDTWPRLQ